MSARTAKPGRRGILASLRTGIDQPGAGTWRPPTRRAFVAMLGAAAAAFAATSRAVGRAVGREQPDAAPPRSAATVTTRWIGHC